MKKPNQQEIQDEAEALLDIKLHVPRHNLRGGDNHDAIDAQVQVLRGEVADEDIDGMNWGAYVLNHAHRAARWMAGEYPVESLALQWREIVHE